MPDRLRPAPEPVQLDTRRIVRAGTVLFAIAAVVTVIVPALRTHSGGVLLWTALTGAALGLLGQAVMAWQKAP